MTGRWVQITCAESHTLRRAATRVLAGRTDVEAGVFYREWADDNDQPVLLDDETPDTCKHYRWAVGLPDVRDYADRIGEYFSKESTR